MKRLLVCAVPLLLGGCYSYVRAPANTIPAGARTTVLLSSQGSVDVQPSLGANVEELHGTLTRATPDSVEIFATRLKRRGSDWTLVSTPVTLSSAAYSQVRERRFSAVKSAGAALGLLGALWLGLSSDLLGFGDDRDREDPNPIPQPPAN
ncbi:MAG: hypothetical protein ABIV11_08540 [Gemmatimonadaceae bacterium]